MNKRMVVASVIILSLAGKMVLAQEAPKSTPAPEAPMSTAAPEAPKSTAAPEAPPSAAAQAAPKSAAPKRAALRGPNRSVGARTAACKLDCTAGNLHGNYRAYGASDPQLKSPEGKKLFAECVRLCLDPLPGTYAQKIFVENGGSWFGKTKSDCLGCHAEGKPKRYWPGVNTLPDSLRR